MSFAIDIETIPDLSMIDLLPEVTANKVLKDPAKIAADIEEKKRKQIETMALDSVFAKVVCISIYNPNEKYVLMGEEEEIIGQFWDIVGTKSQLITYNGKGFDLDVLLKRGIRYGIGKFAIDKFIRERYKSGRVVDIMEDFCKPGESRSLNTLAKVYLGKEKREIDVKTFPELLKTEEGRAQIGEYCLHDARLTWELAEKFGYYLD